VVPIGTIDAYFVKATHLSMHGFPFSTAAKSWRWSRRNGIQYGHHDCLNLRRTGLKEVTCGDFLSCVISFVALEEVNKPRTAPSVKFGNHID
jgi:hypothetical protein